MTSVDFSGDGQLGAQVFGNNIQIVQTAIITNVSGLHGAPPTLNFPNPVTAGNTIIYVACVYNNSAYPMSADTPLFNQELVTATFAAWDPGNTNGIYSVASFAVFQTAWVLPDCPAGNGITCSIANMQQAKLVVAWEVAGLGPTPVIDVIAANAGFGTAMDSIATNNTGFVPELVVGAGTSIGGSSAAPFNWTPVGGGDAWAGYQISDAIGESFEWTQTVGNDCWVAGVLAVYAPLVFAPTPSSVPSSDEGRFRFIVEQAVTGQILSRDLQVQKPKVLRALSGPAKIEFDVDYRDLSALGISFNPWGFWIHAEKEIYGERKIWASCIVQPGEVDKKSGVLHLQAEGYSGYPMGMPWLENWNPLVVDPFEVVIKIWHHLQSYANGKIGVTVYPAASGLEMLPGYAFDGNILNLNFWAEYIRAEDKNDCGKFIDSLAQNIPFDYVEQSNWNTARTAIQKNIFLGYPKAGVQQDYLSFILNENVIEALPHVEAQIDWASDVIIDGWFPGSEYSATFTNPLPNRFRRVLSEDDARINSNEIAAAWADRKLTKRQTPAYWTDISVIMGHPNAPFGTYDVGDEIWVTGYMPWVGDVHQLHKILAIQVNEEEGTAELTLMASGAFNYAPVFYQGSSSGATTMVQASTPNVVIANGGTSAIGPG